ncbi:bifunctional ornithine acetyltransferase/N-acetylglutamate synthase [Sandaracinobacteroides saxicola]|uniref:Arginine biosynthesis bifunctional protein ArgJ n=1 Tax=Sandaracinobacteroides saxicola TaxID=2759707 RepID=A0A7G5IIH3_9SPHN|nr:bifunctional ornithine acetyltransferase/N-acetylglutamate synthase [Sandaracinobacteroides saxicola]QMW23165.1 bifunctional ornithine acetyltransferase/N-acetylglutamate synthase [Sandaracinobacteroides saxicola]
MPVSPLATPFPALPTLPGVRIGTATAGYKPWTRADVTAIAFPPGTSVAGVTTRSACPSPEVETCRANLASGQARALLVNAGNSNAFTGAAGAAASAAQVAALATLLDCDPAHIFPASTGVIGVPLPRDKAIAGVQAAHAALGTASWLDATHAIGTTDTFPKAAMTQAIVGGQTVTLVGFIKGSGMIAPDMATMLGFIVTDAALHPTALQAALTQATATTFNCITVDSDTSTSDTILAFATGSPLPFTGGATRAASGGGETTGGGEMSGGGEVAAIEPPPAFQAALTDLCRQLAQLVVRDGEGATKFIEIRVTGATTDASARTIALSIANSPLVKTAIAGEDANWGRIVMAVGKAGEPADRDRLSISFGGTTVAQHGTVVPGYDEAPVAAHLKGQDIDIAVDLGLGEGRATVWTCDLTHGYVSINADYRS